MTTSDSTSVEEALRVRLRRDPGDQLVIDGAPTTVRWPVSFIRVGAGLFAELVIDTPTQIMSLALDPGANVDELLHMIWRRTLNRTPYEIGEVDAGLAEPLLVIQGPAPYITAFALSPCSVFRQPDATAFAALVAVPTPEYVLLHMFMDEPLRDRDAIAARMRKIARENFEAYDEAKRISPEVYLSYASRGLMLEKL